MEIVIKYSSKWNVSSLLEKGAGATKNTKYNNISNNTILGCLARNMGQIDKLPNLLKSWNLLNKIEQNMSFVDKEVIPQYETLYLRSQNQGDGNQSGGMAGKLLKNPLFDDIEIVKSFSMLFLTQEEAIDYILNDAIPEERVAKITSKLTPSVVWKRAGSIKDKADISYETYLLLKEKANEFVSKFELRGEKQVEEGKVKKEEIYLAGLYNFALNKYYRENIKSQEKFSHLKDNISGFSGANPLGAITPRSFMEQFSSRKCVSTGAPIAQNHRDLEKVGLNATKQSGEVIVTIENLTSEEESEIKDAMEFNGITSFTFGKKGLAWIGSIK
jgi:hypothetical protein